MLIKFTDRNLQTHYEGVVQQYKLGGWVKPADRLKALRGGACGQGSLHLMKTVRPIYAPHPYLAHEATGWGKLGEDQEKVRYRKVKLLRTLTDNEIDQAIDKDWEEHLGLPGLFLPIAWVRNATFLDRKVDEDKCRELLAGVLQLIGCNKPIKFIFKDVPLWHSLRRSLWDSLWYPLEYSLRGSLKYSLRYSLWDSLRYERGFALAGKPKQELADLLEVWKLGACPLGTTKDSLVVLTGK